MIVQLIQTGKEGHVWANEYDRKWDDVLSVQSEVAQTVARELNTIITPEEKALIEKVPTTNLSAYDLFMRAEDYRKEYAKTFAADYNTYQKAVTLFNAALGIDSSFARAYAGLAAIYSMRYYFGSFFIENFLDSVLVLADIAISYDDQLDGAYLTKASYYWFKGRGEDALANCDKAKEYIQEALSLDGDSANYFLWLSYIELYSGNLENAALLSEKANQPVGEYFSFAGHDREAYKIAENVVENLKKTGGVPFKYAHRIGYAYWKMGKTKEAEYWFNEQIRIGTESIKQGSIDAIWKTAQYDLAAVYAFLGDKEKAYQYLDEVNSGRFALQLIPYIKYDCLFNSIRNEERFQKILSDMESKYQAEHERVRKWM